MIYDNIGEIDKYFNTLKDHGVLELLENGTYRINPEVSITLGDSNEHIMSLYDNYSFMNEEKYD